MNIITIFCTVVIINYNYRTPRTHKMPYWIRRLCIDILPRILRMERPKKYEREDNIHVTEADRAKQTMMNYIQASRALSIASPMMMHNNSTTTSNMNSNHHQDEEVELKKRHTAKKRHHHHHRHNKRHQQSSSTDDDDQDNHLTSQEVDLLLTKEAYEAAEDLSFIANHMRSACHYEEVGVHDGSPLDLSFSSRFAMIGNTSPRSSIAFNCSSSLLSLPGERWRFSSTLHTFSVSSINMLSWKVGIRHLVLPVEQTFSERTDLWLEYSFLLLLLLYIVNADQHPTFAFLHNELTGCCASLLSFSDSWWLIGLVVFISLRSCKS